MRRLAPVLAIACLGAAALAPPASAAFGLKDLDVTFTDSAGGPAMQAGTHPFALTTNVAFNTVPNPDWGFEVPDGAPKDITVAQVPGLVADPTATPRCATVDFIDEQCPVASQVGVNEVVVGDPNSVQTVPVHNLVPPPGVVARLGFVVLTVPISVDLKLNTEYPYNGIAALRNVLEVEPVYSSRLTVWGTPADPEHDSERVGCGAAGCSLNIEEEPFLTVPRACNGPLPTVFKANSWQNPGVFDEQSVLTHGGFGACSKLRFAPRISALATTDRAESPSGLDFSLEIDDAGLVEPDGRAHSDIRKAVVSLPRGMTVNPSVAEGLGVCTPGDLARETLASAFGEGCPAASKLGTVEVETPLLEGELLKGSLFVAQQDDPATSSPGAENPFDTMIALYIVIKHPTLGILVKLAGKVEPSPDTGQLVSTFGDPGAADPAFRQLPQLPFSDFRLHFREGGRSPLITPPGCGEFSTRAEFTPWANPGSTLSTGASFTINGGVGGGSCPAGGPPFGPGFEAGSINNNAGSFSPFYMRLTRRDGDQDMTKFSSVLPPGLLGKLAGVGKCPQAQIDAAESRTGREELASPSCPAGSQIGRILAGAGVGSQLTYVPGRAYLAGPYRGAPLSVAVITPAVAGPFDAGTVVVQVGLRLNRVTAQVQADGSSSDPIPHMLEGIPLKLRDIRVYIDRSNFTLNPTSCDPFQVSALLWGGGDPLNPLDDAPAPLADRFQAAGCGKLGFKPRLTFTLRGGTKRGDFPALRAVLRPRPGDANLARAAVRLPNAAFIEQGHFRTICTRVQFAADACPAGATYGRVRAFSPLLDEPLEGPAILRSSSNPLPDLVFDLRGIVDIEASARIDSKKGRLRAVFRGIPDAPVSKVVVNMRGGEKGLFVNSRNICAKTYRAGVRFDAQNGKRRSLRPRWKPKACVKRASRKHRARPGRG